MSPIFRRPGRAWLRRSAGIALLLLGVGVGAPAAAQTTDAVERLRQVLRTPSPDAAARDAALKEGLGRLRNLADMRRALLLSEWRLAGPISAEGQVDALNRTFLAERFLQEVRALWQRGDGV